MISYYVCTNCQLWYPAWRVIEHGRNLNHNEFHDSSKSYLYKITKNNNMATKEFIVEHTNMIHCLTYLQILPYAHIITLHYRLEQKQLISELTGKQKNQ